MGGDGLVANLRNIFLFLAIRFLSDSLAATLPQLAAFQG
jgi:hypothetical protein